MKEVDREKRRGTANLLIAVSEEFHVGDRGLREKLAIGGIVVHVYLSDFDGGNIGKNLQVKSACCKGGTRVQRSYLGEELQGGSDGEARATPISPEIHEELGVAVDNNLVERISHELINLDRKSLRIVRNARATGPCTSGCSGSRSFGGRGPLFL